MPLPYPVFLQIMQQIQKSRPKERLFKILKVPINENRIRSRGSVPFEQDMAHQPVPVF